MATYAIGDIQGCFGPLQKLLEQIHFDPTIDELWFTGDLVNRGPASLETLRFIKNLGTQQRTVLGNHDLHLLAVAANACPGQQNGPLQPILDAEDRKELLDWLIQQPLLYHDPAKGYVLVHAGLAPNWSLSTAAQLAHEVEAILQSDNANSFFFNMYGNVPDYWTADLTGWPRLRCITNYFTRMRFCYQDGRLELQNKGPLNNNKDNPLVPWFQVPHRMNQDVKIIFGHWAALRGITHTANVYALDTGCVWGNALTALRLDDLKRFQVACTGLNR